MDDVDKFLQVHFIIHNSSSFPSFVICTDFFAAASSNDRTNCPENPGMEMLRQFWQLCSSDRVRDGRDCDSYVIDGNTTRDNFNCQDPVTQSSRSGLIINE